MAETNAIEKVYTEFEFPLKSQSNLRFIINDCMRVFKCHAETVKNYYSIIGGTDPTTHGKN